MKKLSYTVRIFFGIIGFTILFLLNFLYIFLALGFLSLGLIVFPASLLGMLDVIIVTTDLGLPVLAAAGIGFILLGGGMCFGAAFVCPGSLKRFHWFCKGTEWRKRRLRDEKA
ncbi:MAG: hypothetical protein IJX15_08805 [Ruminiclostridium sp.]|nr:hypothetical protein [Ruminiclostridium sp.]MBQ8841603.1 hypothetical protein [Ruminiclostridium sp.]